MAETDVYQTPLTRRYASEEMSQNFSERRKITLWRQLWIWLAESQSELGVNITKEQLDEMRNARDNIDFEYAAEEECKRRHDVMAHVSTYAKSCPKASPIIHLGATSCYVGDNTDLIVLRDALAILTPRLARVIDRFAKQAIAHCEVVCLGRTHLQPAQPTTVGRRMCMWIQDMLTDLQELERIQNNLRFRGTKGAIGTQASFLDLFGGDSAKVIHLDRLVANKAGFEGRLWPVCGQTYPRKVDVQILNALASLGATIYKICADIRLLSSFKEIDEPFEAGAAAHGAIPYKRNPIRSERACALARLLMSMPNNGLHTYAEQWLERSLDDSATRRVMLPEACLLADGCLNILQTIAEGLLVNKKVIERNLMQELPFMAAEKLLVIMVRDHGCDRQECHERIRKHSQAAGMVVKGEGKDNDLLQRLKLDSYFSPIACQLDKMMDPQMFVGRAVEQTKLFIQYDVDYLLKPFADRMENESSVVKL